MIITFYSFKGGLGRSMTLANVAEILYRRGLRVLLIDWDLEAPGLDQFFDSVVNHNIKERLGLIDILMAYKDWSVKPAGKTVELPPALWKYTQDIYPPNEHGAWLKMVSAGRRDGKYFDQYVRCVKSFDWQDFYENWEGQSYLEWIRSQMEDMSDVVLIDSRTGVTEMGNVCIYHLADLVIAFTSASRQSLEGTARVVKTFDAPYSQDLRIDDHLPAIVIPARVEDKAELASYNSFKQSFSDLFDQYCPRRWHEETQQTLWDLRIPYVPLYAFEELVAVRQKETEQASDLLEQAFERIVEAIEYVIPLPRPGPRSVLIVDDNEQWQMILSELLSSSGYEVDIADSAESGIEILQDNLYGLVLLNLNLKQGLDQDYSGLSVLRWMKDHGLVIPVVIVTGSPVSMGQFKRWPVVRDVIFKGTDVASPQSRERIRELLFQSMESPLFDSHALGEPR